MNDRNFPIDMTSQRIGLNLDDRMNCDNLKQLYRPTVCSRSISSLFSCLFTSEAGYIWPLLAFLLIADIREGGKVRKVLMETESLLSVLKRDSHGSVSKEDLREYLSKHFSKSKFQKIEDFPTDLAWINTASPLSIHRDLKGKVVLLDFFTYCCINCMHILPDLKILEKKYSVEDGFVVIGVHCGKFENERETKNIASAVKRYEVEHAVVNDSDATVWHSFDIHCWPTLVLIGPHGELLLKLSGEGHLETLDSVIGITLEVMKEKSILSAHALPQIKDTGEMKSFGALSFPGKVASFIDENVRSIGIADTGHHRILIVDNDGNVQFTIGGLDAGFQDGDFDSCKFRAPQGLVFKNKNLIYVADTENHAIREVDLSTKKVKTVTGTGKQGKDEKGGNLWTEQEISSPWDVCFGKNENVLLIAMAGHHQIWALYLSDDKQHLFKKGKLGECVAIAGSGREENRNNCYPHTAAFAQPSGLAYCPDRDSIFIADSESSSIRELNLGSGKVNAVVGAENNPKNLFAYGDHDGEAYDVKLQHALGVTWHAEEKILYVADSYNHKVKKVDVFKNICSTVKVNAELDEPGGLCAYGNKILIADTNHHCIKAFDCKSSSISTLSVTWLKSNPAEPIHGEQTLEMAENGGSIEVSISLKKSEGLSFTEGAPAFWLINFCDENSQKVAGHEKRENLGLESKFVVQVPAPSQNSIAKVLIDGSMYVCQEDSCSMKNLRFIINLRPSKTANASPSCEFAHVIGNNDG